MRIVSLLLIALIAVLSFGRNVTFDTRSLVIDGKRQLFVSASMHYPRSTPEMWPSLLQKMKDFGANMLEMYDFWTCHEAVKGVYNFEGRYDVVRFIKEAQKVGLYVFLRVGPFVDAEWNYGGLPVWLKFENNITFRTNNPQYKAAMKTWVNYLINLLKKNNLFYPQGGPIVAAQIENEYGYYENEYGEDGKKYVQWAAELAKNTSVGVPWTMCKQDDAPADIINTCNGFYCDDWIAEHKKKFPNQPSFFTEHWQAWYQKWGEARPNRPVEDTAFSVLRWYARGGTLMNYYTFNGGNSYGRLGGGPGFVTAYLFGGIIDEFGVLMTKKFDHLKALNNVLMNNADIILSQDPEHQQIETNVEAHIYGKIGGKCVAFLSNLDPALNKTVKFNGKTFLVPSWSVSVLTDCSNEAYNSAKAPIKEETFSFEETKTVGASVMGWIDEEIASAGNPEYFKAPREQISKTKDTTDYLWYSTVFNAEAKKKCLLSLTDAKDLFHIFINKTYAGTTTANLTIELEGKQEINILSMTLGLISFGSFFEKYSRGILGSVMLCNKNITENTWKHVVGLMGEAKKYYDPLVYDKLTWNPKVNETKKRPLTWFIKKLNISQKSKSLALDMKSMSKGYVWINGNNVGRYYNAIAVGKCEPCDYRGVYTRDKCRTGCNEMSQRFYHIAPDWIKIGENTVIVFEEIGGDIEGVKLVEKLAETIASE